MVQKPDCGGSTRRTFLKATSGVALATGVAGCIGATDDGAVRFVLNPAEEQTDILEEYTPMKEYLEEETGATIDLTRAGSYVETLEALETDQADIADTSPTAVPAGEGFADVLGMRTAFGGALYFSTIATTPDSDIEELADLEGGLITTGARMSTSGTLAPSVMLSEAGIDIGDFPEGDANDLEIRTATDHDTSRERLVNDDDIVAAATGAFASAPQIPQEQFDEYSEFVEHSAEYDDAGSDLEDGEPELQLLAVSDPLPRAPIMARSEWDDPEREDIEEALLAAGEDDLIPDDVDEDYELWFTGIQDADQSDYEPIQEILDELGLEFQDFDDDE
ncbi:substrate-binding domain-containing protein [Natronobacterium gregoryi]|uniref:ABC-type phosphate/phosphonate transport system, periplasmic component n=2 Tax=Natronobacterium gregoryi TaxID=44930 RepID=L0AF88_NATGS|nr:substrate-binding domain-containing protein [Natronobacterium gregoryi]AFZ72578.1 ABC-type phosphate/phosphonate transport system, periplasmic component [Natronobacterium gregoryi SP2]ELY71903.1 phosphate ABC transporter substrate-binding protein [Natronobacterium gregoryi SP2]PLK19341.1 phosphate-binding protein [Natronobacterium gregoryi SP2]SFJ52391.1 phosphonate transport system substrate-binding protein [Natronobacterium gregoryi]